MKIFLKNDIFS